MSTLRVYWPDDCAPPTQDPTAWLVPFPTTAAPVSVKQERLSVEARARLLHANRLCRICGCGSVAPLVGSDTLVNRAGQPIPGTATIHAFHCNGCGTEWSV